MTANEDTERSSDLAIVGLSGRYPMADDIDRFWEMLRDGREAVTFFTEEEVVASGVDHATAAHPSFVRARAILNAVELFDAEFFSYSPREAETLDPQHRFFLECAWNALESAGYNPYTYPGRIGVFGSASMSSYLFNNLMASRDGSEAFQVLLGNDRNHLTTTVSYKLDLRGPSINIQTACSASLVAFHYACQSLLLGESDMCLAGGVSITIPQKTGHLYQEGGIYSPDGHCRAFDREAQGIVGGNGVGVVVVKRLDDALRDGDTIHAVVKGTATNNDGAAKVGYTAPSAEAQTAVIAEALAVAGVDAGSISYVETHGTGTYLGDPIEVAALTDAYRLTTDKSGFCAIGSVKSNIGHLDAGAGVAGLIKTVLALRHAVIPPTLHVSRPNPGIDFANSPFYITGEAQPWTRDGATPRRAGVSAFGLGGANAHVVLEEAPVPEPSGPSRPWQLLSLSARSEAALETATANLTAHLRDHPEQGLADVAYVYHAGKRAFAHRRALLCRDRDDAIAALASRDPRRLLAGAVESGPPPVVFMFPGLGDHYVGMARGLYEAELDFRAEVDRCAEMLRPHLGLDIREVLFAGGAHDEPAFAGAKPDLRAMLRRNGAGEDEANRRLNETRLVHPALFVIEYALARLWMAWGVQPEALIGYSVGEYVAACLAGVFSLEDALELVARRAALVETLPPGAMLTVSLSEEALRPLLGDGLALAAAGGPMLSTVAGTPEAVTELEERLTGEGIACRRLPAGYAFHTPMMEPIATPFVAMVADVALLPPSIPLISNVTGRWLTDGEATDPNYWARHMCRTVRFSDGLRTLADRPERVFLEVGPGRGLCALASARPDGAAHVRLAVPSLPAAYEREPAMATVLGALGRLWLAGIEVDWDGFYAHERRRRVPTPTYPFERRRYWVEARQALGTGSRTTALPKRSDIADWFAVPSWKRVPLVSPDTTPAESWLLLCDEAGFGDALARRLREAGERVTAVSMGARFDGDGTRYICRPGSDADFEALLDELQRTDRLPTRVVHLWGLDTVANGGVASLDAFQPHGLETLLVLGRTLGPRPGRKVEIAVVASGLYDVESSDRLDPAKAGLLGPCRVLPQEYPNLACRDIDVQPPDGNPAGLIEHLIAELRVPAAGMSVAYRGASRWVQMYEPLRLPEGGAARGLREQGVYLMAGRLGSIGLTLAKHLTRTVRARLVFAGETGLPPRGQWRTRPSGADGDIVAAKIDALLACEADGAEIAVLDTDLTDAAAACAAISYARARFGALDGVIYAAGAAGSDAVRPVSDTRAEDIDWHFRYKVRGLFALSKALEEEPVDFCLVVSSLSSVLGGLGLTAHASAHFVMDAIARRERSGGRPWTAVNWNWADWHGPAPDREEYARLGGSVSEYQISPAEGVETFARVVGLRDVAQVVVSSADLEGRLDQWVRRQPASREREPNGTASARATTALYPRPSLPYDYHPPQTPLEQRLVSIWEELLGIEQVGVHDNFFDLGGHSLLGTQLVTRLRDDLDRAVGLRELLSAPTVAELAALLEGHETIGAEAVAGE